MMLASGLIIDSFVCYGDSVDQQAYDFHNCFKTKEEAKTKLEQIKQLLKK